MTSNPVRKLGAERLMSHDHTVRRLAAKVPNGTKLSDIMHPEYFQNYIHLLSWGTQIAVLSEDLKLDCVLRVVGHDQTTVMVRLLHVFEALDMPEDAKKADIPTRVAETVSKDVAPTSDYKVEWAGKDKWRITHAGKVLEKGMISEEVAKKRLEALLLK